MRKILIIIIAALLLAGCATTGNNTEDGARKGLAIGAAAGAILGQVIGGDTKATLIGASIGTVVGGLAGHSYGKKMDEQEAELRKQLAAIEEANIQRDQDILTVTMGSDLLFDVGSALIKPEGIDQLGKVAEVLNKCSDTLIIIAGHTDSTGSESSNQNLSEHRAQNAKMEIVNQGVHPSRIRTMGFGASAPLAENNTEAGRRLNRRVVITIHSPQS